MILQLARARRRRVLIDINTQKDFLLAGGNACVRNHRRVLGHIRRVMAWARGNNVPVISTCDIYPSNSNNNNNNNNNDCEVQCCVDGTEGQKKVRYTLLNKRLCFAADGNTDLPRDMLRRYQQVVLQKRCVDPFDEPRIDRLLSELRAGEFVLIGASAEGAIMATALGLLQRGKKVSVVVDAVGSHNSKEGKMAFRKMEAKGAKLIDTKRLAGTSHLHVVGACHCESCQGLRRKAPIGLAEKN